MGLWCISLVWSWQDCAASGSLSWLSPYSSLKWLLRVASGCCHPHPNPKPRPHPHPRLLRLVPILLLILSTSKTINRHHVKVHAVPQNAGGQRSDCGPDHVLTKRKDKSGPLTAAVVGREGSLALALGCRLAHLREDPAVPHCLGQFLQLLLCCTPVQTGAGHGLGPRRFAATLNILQSNERKGAV